MRRESFLIEQQRKNLGGEIKAIERWATEGAFKEGDAKPANLPEILAGLDAARKRWSGLEKRLSGLTERLDRAASSVGAGDAVDRDHDSQRTALLETHERIERFVDGAIGPGGQASGATELRRRAVALVARLERVCQVIDQTAQSKAGEFQGELEAERQLLDGYTRTIAAFQRDSDRMSHDVGGPLFRDAKTRLDDVVLEADMGQVDIAWKRKQRESERIAELQKERADALKLLETAIDGLQKPQ